MLSITERFTGTVLCVFSEHKDCHSRLGSIIMQLQVRIFPEDRMYLPVRYHRNRLHKQKSRLCGEPGEL